MAISCNTSPLNSNSQKANNQQNETKVIIQQIPIFDLAYAIGGVDDKISGTDLALAMTIFYLEWTDAFGDPERKVFNNLNNITILMSKTQEEVYNCYDINGNFLPVAYASGLAHNNQLIWIWSSNNIISNTSFVHELVHVAIWSENPTGDADHEGDNVVLWTKKHTSFIEKTNKILKEHGL